MRLRHLFLAGCIAESVGLTVGATALSASHWASGPKDDRLVRALNTLPLNALGIASHYIASAPIPRPSREGIYLGYCKLVGCNISETYGKLDEFKSLADFFARQIRDDLRPIADANLTSPCDGTVIAAGPVGAFGSIEVKNIRYRIRELVGATEREPLAVSSVAVADREESGSRLWYTVIHIPPSDCHRFASPATWTLKQRNHIPGHLFWMNPSLHNLYAQNERVALLGEWDHGLMSVIAVGATGRGSISLDVERGDSEETFRPKLKPNPSSVSRKEFSSSVPLSRGQELGGFRLGSAVVLVFEAPTKNFMFEVSPGEKIARGQKLADFAADSIDSVKVHQTVTTKKAIEQRFSEKPADSRARFRRAW